MIKLQITNTMSGKKEIFESQVHGAVSMYVCGITPYDYAHIGHGRVYVLFDLVYRLLTSMGNKVTYCRNFTDIDDKILNKAEKELGNKELYLEIANRYISSFTEDMKSLNCVTPDHQPRVTESIQDIISFIQGLIDNGHAYEVAGDVYYYVPSFKQYGELSKRSLEDLQVGARVELNELKKSPYDFALWKSEDEGTFWKSPWGYGRPGWHIECSAMSLEYLGYPIDIHGGGMDLIFPHHENENAQSCGLYDSFVRYWVHSAFVTIDKEKMSKSLGNFVTLKDVFKRFDPMVLRYYYLSHYFRAPLEFSFADLESASKSYQRLALLFHEHKCSSCATPFSLQESNANPIAQGMIAHMLDDLNMAGMFGVLFENMNSLRSQPQSLCVIKKLLTHVIGLSLQPLPEKQVEITPEIQRLIDLREQARTTKDWVRADAIRKQLTDLGYTAHDTKIKS
jgi:cysteinyl-tRNA synthetase